MLYRWYIELGGYVFQTFQILFYSHGCLKNAWIERINLYAYEYRFQANPPKDFSTYSWLIPYHQQGLCQDRQFRWYVLWPHTVSRPSDAENYNIHHSTNIRFISPLNKSEYWHKDSGGLAWKTNNLICEIYNQRKCSYHITGVSFR